MKRKPLKQSWWCVLEKEPDGEAILAKATVRRQARDFLRSQKARYPVSAKRFRVAHVRITEVR